MINFDLTFRLNNKVVIPLNYWISIEFLTILKIPGVLHILTAATNIKYSILQKIRDYTQSRCQAYMTLLAIISTILCSTIFQENVFYSIIVLLCLFFLSASLRRSSQVRHFQPCITISFLVVAVPQHPLQLCKSGSETPSIHTYTALQKLRYNLFWCFLVLRIILKQMNIRTWN